MSEQTSIRKDGAYWCKAILGIWIDGFVEGFLDGYEKVCGEKYPDSYEDILLSALKVCVKRGRIPITQAAEEANMTVDEFETKVLKLNL